MSVESLDFEINEVLNDFKNEVNITNEVTVTILDLTWMFANGEDFLSFVNILYNSKRSEIFASELVKSLQQHFWHENFLEVLYLWFLPFMVYFFTNISFTILALQNAAELEEKLHSDFEVEPVKVRTYLILTTILLAYLLVGEIL